MPDTVKNSMINILKVNEETDNYASNFDKYDYS